MIHHLNVITGWGNGFNSDLAGELLLTILIILGLALLVLLVHTEKLQKVKKQFVDNWREKRRKQ